MKLNSGNFKKNLNIAKRKILLRKELFSIPSFELSKTSGSTDHKSYLAVIETEYRKYIEEISSAEMAASLELSQFIFEFVENKKPLKIVDMGSGFSSFVIRFYQKLHPELSIECFSVEDDSSWQDKTIKYLEEKNVSAENILSPDDFFKRITSTYFDLIILDLNFVEVRKKYISPCLNILRKGGFLIIDDVHKVEFLREIKKTAKKAELPLLNLEKITKDRFGRFAVMIQK
ncbi:MAG TPA: hypothetical protein PLR45_00350 [Flavobacteriales bacterium]|nr:hypothetical protein [Flavobacteriales bacterium]